MICDMKFARGMIYNKISNEERNAIFGD
jgi:hypothetical protein